jgi:hypothetical protein
MKGSGYESTRFCWASTEYVSADFFHPDVASVPRPDARSYLDTWPPDYHQNLTDRAPVREGASLLISPGLLTTPMVSLILQWYL